jgi:hypothetical protein
MACFACQRRSPDSLYKLQLKSHPGSRSKIDPLGDVSSLLAVVKRFRFQAATSNGSVFDGRMASSQFCNNLLQNLLNRLSFRKNAALEVLDGMRSYCGELAFACF